MYRKEFSRPKRKSMLGKRRQNTATESTKPVSITKNKEMLNKNNLFSVTRSLPRSKLGRRLQDEIENVQPQVKLKKCLFNRSSEGKCPNYEISPDISGIVNLTPCSINQHENHSAYKRSQKKPNDFMTAQKELEHHRTCLKELNFSKRSAITPHSSMFTLKTPTPPPPLYDMYLQRKFKSPGCTSTANKVYDPSSLENFTNHNYRSHSQKHYNNTIDIENNSISSPTEINYNSTDKNIHLKVSWGNVFVTNNTETESNLNHTSKVLDCLENSENSSPFSNKLSIEKKYSGCNTEMSKSMYNIPFSNDSCQVECQKNIFETSISQESDDSFLFNEQNTLIGNISDTDLSINNKTVKLSMIKEEASPSKTIFNWEFAIDSCNEALTQPNYKSQLCKVIKSSQVNSLSNSAEITTDHLQTVVEAMFKEDTELLTSFQKNIFNNCSNKLKATFNEIVKKLGLSTLPKDFENILDDHAHVLKNIFVNQNEECGKLINQLKGKLNYNTDKNKNKEINKTLNYLELEKENILKENEKLVNKLQNDITQRFQKELCSIVDQDEHIDAILNVMNDDIEATLAVNFESMAQQIEFKKQQCLSYLKSIKAILNEGVLKDNIRSCQLEEKINCLMTDLNNISNLHSELVNSFKSLILIQYQDKIPILVDNIMKQKTKEILNAFKANIQENIVQFTSQLKSQTEKCVHLKENITQNIERFENASEKSEVFNCTASPTTQEKFKSPQKVQHTNQMYSELKTQFKHYLRTPVASTKKTKRFSNTSFNVLTPCSMSTIINDQVNDLPNS